MNMTFIQLISSCYKNLTKVMKAKTNSTKTSSPMKRYKLSMTK